MKPNVAKTNGPSPQKIRDRNKIRQMARSLDHAAYMKQKYSIGKQKAQAVK